MDIFYPLAGRRHNASILVFPAGANYFLKYALSLTAFIAVDTLKDVLFPVFLVFYGPIRIAQDGPGNTDQIRLAFFENLVGCLRIRDTTGGNDGKGVSRLIEDCLDLIGKMNIDFFVHPARGHGPVAAVAGIGIQDLARTEDGILETAARGHADIIEPQLGQTQDNGLGLGGVLPPVVNSSTLMRAPMTKSSPSALRVATSTYSLR